MKTAKKAAKKYPAHERAKDEQRKHGKISSATMEQVLDEIERWIDDQLKIP